jgi:hypothetical protein
MTIRVAQDCWLDGEGWRHDKSAPCGSGAGLVLVFGATNLLRDEALFRDIRTRYPDALVVGCSTAGEICDTRVRDGSLSVSAVSFEHTRIDFAEMRTGSGGSRSAGERLARQLDKPGLAHMMVLSDGLKVNGTELAKGLRENLPPGVAVTGGLAGDGDRFSQTLVCVQGAGEEGRIVAVGFYGDRLKIGYGSLGGWDTFGPERLITKSRGNVLYELDDRSALGLYKRYLGEHAAGLPATGLLFPLALRDGAEQSDGLVRTVLAVDEQAQSMTFAGDMPEGSYARLMKANFDRLVDGAVAAAAESSRLLGGREPQLAVLISCVGRKLVLKQRVEDEVDGVRNVFGTGTALTGFYSYGEIAPHLPLGRCELHNQTMTITAFAEE